MAIAEKRRRFCAYCGLTANTGDHVVPRALYPPSLAQSRVQRIVVHACRPCNASWQDDEAHFRNMLMLCGPANAITHEVWSGATIRSFDQVDGLRRLRDLSAQMVAVSTPEGERHKVYPEHDERFMRVLRKVIRGLSHHHQVGSGPILDGQVSAFVLRDEVPQEVLTAMTYAHADESVLRYFFSSAHPDFHSGWFLEFYGRASFMGLVYQSIEAREQAYAAA